MIFTKKKKLWAAAQCLLFFECTEQRNILPRYALVFWHLLTVKFYLPNIKFFLNDTIIILVWSLNCFKNKLSIARSEKTLKGWGKTWHTAVVWKGKNRNPKYFQSWICRFEPGFNSFVLKFWRTRASIFLLTHFQPLIYSIPHESIINSEVFVCFQGL